MVDLVILSRDGVVNEDTGGEVRSPEQFDPIAGSLDAIARLNRAGRRVVMATNQSGLRRRILDIETLNDIHDKMQHLLAEVGGRIEAVFICPCRPRDECECYKPRPGMLLDIATRLRVTLEGVPVIGAELRDVEAARAVGARPILVRTGEAFRPGAEHAIPNDVEVEDNLAGAVDRLLAIDAKGAAES